MAIFTCTNLTQLNAAIAACAYGDTIKCAEGVTFTSTSDNGIYFPIKSGFTGTEEILVTTTATTGLPADGQRTDPSYAAKMPSFQSIQASASQNSPAVQVAPGASGWTFRHCRFLQTYYGSGSHVRVGRASTSLQYKKSQQPTHIRFDRCLWSVPNQYWSSHRGIECHGVHISFDSCYFEPCGSSGGPDSQCLTMANGYGPYTIHNTFFGGATYNVFTMGTDTTLRTTAVIQASPVPTTTVFKVDWSASAHPDSDPPVAGDFLAIVTQSGAMRRHGWVQSYTAATASSGTVTLVDPIPEVPFTGGQCLWGVVPRDLTITQCLVESPASWLTRVVVPNVTGVAASKSAGGSLTAGVYNVRVAARITLQEGSLRSGNATAPIAVTAVLNDRLNISWAAHADAQEFRVYVQLPDLTWRYKTIASGTLSTTFSAMTEGTVIASIPSAATWEQKNLFELKGVIRADISGCVIRHSGPGSASGYPIWLKVTNQDGSCEYNVFKDVDFHHNIIHDTLGILSTSSQEWYTSNQADRPGKVDTLLFRHNLCYNTGAGQYTGGFTSNWGVSFTGGMNITFDHNTVIHTQKAAIRLLGNQAEDNYITPNLVITNNLLIKNTEGVRGGTSGFGNLQGTSSLNEYSQGSYTYANNALAGGSAGNYPAGVGNLFPSQAAFEAYFTDYDGLDFSLAVGSAAIGAGTAGSNLGCDITAVLAATANTVSGTPALGPPPQIQNTSPLPPGPEDAPYSVQFQAFDGELPYTWSVVSGTLPAGLALVGDILSGTPTTPGDYTFTIKVADVNLAESQAVFTLHIEEVFVPVPERNYFPSGVLAPLTPAAVGSGWDEIAAIGAQFKLALSNAKVLTPFVMRDRGQGTNNPGYTLLLLYVGPSLAAQELGGTCKMQIRCGESNASLGGTLAICVRVINSAGVEVAILTNGGDPQPVSSINTATSPPELETITIGTGTTMTNRRLLTAADSPVIPLTSYSCADQDRMVVEIGYRDTTATTSYRGGVVYGDANATDLPEADGFLNPLTPWIEFSQTPALYVEVDPPETGEVLGGSLYLYSYQSTSLFG